MHNSRLLTGKKGVHHSVYDISIMETPDFEEWAKPGTVMLTSLYATQDFSYEQQFDFIKRLHHMEIAACIIKTEKYVKKVPKGIIDGGIHYGMPIIQIPKETSYNIVTKEVMQLLFDEENKRLNYYHKLYEKFLALSLDGLETEDIIHSLKNMIDHSVEFYESDTAYHVQTPLPLAEHIPAEHINEFIVAYDSVTAYVVSIQLEGLKKMYLTIPTHTETLTNHEKIAIHVAASFIKLTYIKNIAIHKRNQQKYVQTIHNLLHDVELPYRSRLNILDRLTLSAESNFVVIIVETYTFNAKLMNLFEDRLTLAWHSDSKLIKYKKQENQLVLMFDKKSENIQEEVYQQLLSMDIAHYEIYIGISEMVNQELDFPKAFDQAEDALALGKQLFSKHGKYVYSYPDMGIYRTFSMLQKEGSLDYYINPKLKKIWNTDEANKDQLIQTLQVFLDEKQRYKNTAAKLHIHWKTVKNRITKITKMTGIQLNRPEEALDIHLSLKLLTFTSEQNI